jgi:hypothetical protein
MKDKTEVWWTRHNKTMPDMAKLQAIVTRDIELVAPADGVIDAAPDENMELFVWWWDELLPCATAPNTEFWTNEKRWYHHIHDGKVGDEPLLTPQDETFAILCFENYYRQWEKDFKIKAKHPKKKLVKANQKDFVPPTDARIKARGYVETETEIVKFGDGWETKYTNAKAGSGLCSGWTTAGKVQYKKLLKYVKRGRNKPTTPAKEALVYAQVRLKNGVTEASHVEYLQAKKRARTGETILDGISLLVDDDDDGEGDGDDASVLSIIEV